LSSFFESHLGHAGVSDRLTSSSNSELQSSQMYSNNGISVDLFSFYVCQGRRSESRGVAPPSDIFCGRQDYTTRFSQSRGGTADFREADLSPCCRKVNFSLKLVRL
jgi:hypothetical protein